MASVFSKGKEADGNLKDLRPSLDTPLLFLFTDRTNPISQSSGTDRPKASKLMHALTAVTIIVSDITHWLYIHLLANR